MIQLSTDHLLFGVVIAIGLNRVFQTSGFRLSRVVYAGVQAVNMGFVLALWFFKITEFAAVPRAELGIRLFLLCFVAWHMVRNSQARARALRRAAEEAEFVAERRARMDAFAASQAEAEKGAQAETVGESSPSDSEVSPER
jgi:hypothetical protein